MTFLIIQARTGSTRLPGKVLRNLNSSLDSIIDLMILRLVRQFDRRQIILATTDLEQDDKLAEVARNHRIEIFRGSSLDVYSRYVAAAREFDAEIIVRLTGDCPLVDPEDIQNGIQMFERGDYDYVSNVIPFDESTFPEGSDFEIFTRYGLEGLSGESVSGHSIEHVTFGFWRANNGFRCGQLQAEFDMSDVRYTLDYEEDLQVIRYLDAEIRRRKIKGTTKEIYEIFSQNPSLKLLNSKYSFGIGWE